MGTYGNAFATIRPNQAVDSYNRVNTPSDKNHAEVTSDQTNSTYCTINPGGWILDGYTSPGWNAPAVVSIGVRFAIRVQYLKNKTTRIRMQFGANTAGTNGFGYIINKRWDATGSSATWVTETLYSGWYGLSDTGYASWSTALVDSIRTYTDVVSSSTAAVRVLELWAEVEYEEKPNLPGSVGGMPADLATNVTPNNRTVVATVTSPQATDWLSLEIQVSEYSDFRTVTETLPGWPFYRIVSQPTTYSSAQAVQSGNVVSTSVPVSTFTRGRVYYWRYRVANNWGQSAYSDTYRFTMQPELVDPPTISGPTGTQTSGSKTLNWTFNQAGTQSGYAVRRKNGIDGTYEYWNGSSWDASETKINSSGARSVSLSFAANASDYYWSVKTWDNTGVASDYAVDQSFAVHSPPTCTVTAPAANVTTGGPNLTATWSYSQAESLPQARYRVRLQNATQDTTYYDSGWLSGTATLHTFNVRDAAPTASLDGASFKVRVDVESSDGSQFQGNASNSSFEIRWGVVTCAVTQPTDGEVYTTTNVTVTWTFNSTRSKTQAAYRVRVLGPQSGYVYHDTGWVSGTDTSYAIPITLQDNTSYQIRVQLRNSEGVPS